MNFPSPSKIRDYTFFLFLQIFRVVMLYFSTAMDFIIIILQKFREIIA